MPAKRKYNIKGTNDFLVLAGIFFFLCLWAIKDAWYPADKVLKKHPREVAVAFKVAGAVARVNVAEGDSVSEKTLLASLRRDHIESDFEQAKDDYTSAKNQHSRMEVAHKNAVKNGATDAGVAERKESMARAQASMDEALAKVTELRKAMDSTELLSPSRGKVKQIVVQAHSMVEAGDTALVLDPKDHFYLFNKSLAIFSFFAFWIFLAIHILAR
jgi:multidrug resistance efflux pump